MQSLSCCTLDSPNLQHCGHLDAHGRFFQIGRLACLDFDSPGHCLCGHHGAHGDFHHLHHEVLHIDYIRFGKQSLSCYILDNPNHQRFGHLGVLGRFFRIARVDYLCFDNLGRFLFGRLSVLGRFCRILDHFLYDRLYAHGQILCLALPVAS